jgi:hypothetical protein
MPYFGHDTATDICTFTPPTQDAYQQLLDKVANLER